MIEFSTLRVRDDEGVAQRLVGMGMPDIQLKATDGTYVDLRGPGLCADVATSQWRHRCRREGRILVLGSRTTCDAIHRSAPARQSNRADRAVERHVSCVLSEISRCLPRSSTSAAFPCRSPVGAAQSASHEPRSGRNRHTVHTRIA